MPKSQTVAVVDKEALAELDAMFPKETGGFTRIQLPRIAYSAQDVMEGTGKNKKVVLEAGTFSLEKQTDEVDENGKKIWKKEEIGNTIDGIVVYYRYQLSFYDESTESYTSSSVYDDVDEVIPLWNGKKQVAKDTPKNLKAMYQYVDAKDGKTKSNLKDNRIVYLLYKGELHQLNLHGSSMFSFMGYKKKVNPATVMTTFASEFKEQGSIQWNMMTFDIKRALNAEEIQEVLGKVKEIQFAIKLEKGDVQDTAKKIEEDEDVEFVRLATGK